MAKLILVRRDILHTQLNRGMDLDHLSEEEVPGLELKTGVPIVYDINEDSQVTGKEILD